jgi:hypothetical protein
MCIYTRHGRRSPSEANTQSTQSHARTECGVPVLLPNAKSVRLCPLRVTAQPNRPNACAPLAMCQTPSARTAAALRATGTPLHMRRASSVQPSAIRSQAPSHAVPRMQPNEDQSPVSQSTRDRRRLPLLLIIFCALRCVASSKPLGRACGLIGAWPCARPRARDARLPGPVPCCAICPHCCCSALRGVGGRPLVSGVSVSRFAPRPTIPLRSRWPPR